MSILDDLANDKIWLEYYNKLQDTESFDNNTCTQWKDYITNHIYLDILNKINSENIEFSLPTKKIINKIETRKKRVVYLFPENENKFLKVLAWQLHKYDDLTSPLCFSFKKNSSPKAAIYHIINDKNIYDKYSYKIDISNYFNSIDTNILMDQLSTLIINDKKLFDFIKYIVTQDKSLFNGSVLSEKRGAMAGCPISAFFANIYLHSVDDYFYKNNILYARYSDDIIFFTDTKEELDHHRTNLYKLIANLSLTINKEKEILTSPHERWDFLGFSYIEKTLDISPISEKKLKGKIKRKSRALYRWKLKKNIQSDLAIKAMIKKLNIKFFNNPKNDQLTWSRWYFPVITTDLTLHRLDQYIQDHLRYISTGRFNKKNYNITYDQLKSLGYKSLVNEYYKWKNTKNMV